MHWPGRGNCNTHVPAWSHHPWCMPVQGGRAGQASLAHQALVRGPHLYPPARRAHEFLASGGVPHMPLEGGVGDADLRRRGGRLGRAGRPKRPGQPAGAAELRKTECVLRPCKLHAGQACMPPVPLPSPPAGGTRPPVRTRRPPFCTLAPRGGPARCCRSFVSTAGGVGGEEGSRPGYAASGCALQG